MQASSGGPKKDVFKTPSQRFIISSAEPGPVVEFQYETGEKIANRYSVEQQIGAGGMCTVYLVNDYVNSNRRVALKLIAGETNPVRIETFRNEFRILSRLEHENLIRVFDFGVLAAGQGFYYTAEYIEGKNFREAAEGTSEDELTEYIVQICRALEYVHSRGYIHYDVKPSNIHVTGNGVVKLTDFGLSALADRALGRRIRGTPAYTSPELITGAAIDVRTDLYSLGVTLYEVFTGTTPFHTQNLHDLFHKHVTELPKPPGAVRPGVPEYMERVILRLLAKNPADRFPSANSIIKQIASARSVEIELQPKTSAEGYLQNPPLLGREEEIEAFHGALDGLREGRAAHISLEGPAGIGRSRLLREINFEAQLRGYATAIGSAEDPELFSKLVGSLAAHPEVDQPVGVQNAGSGGMGLSGNGEALPDTAARVVGIAEQTPVVICIDDLHSAVPQAMGPLARLVQVLDTPAAPPMLIVTTRREDASGEPLETSSTRRFRLSPLSKADVGHVAAGMFGSSAPPELFVSNLAAATAGLPFAVVETMRMLVASGEIAVVEDKWRFRGGLEPFKISPSLEQFYRARAEALKGLDHKLAYNVALMDRPVSMTEVSALHTEPPERIAEALSALKNLGIIRRLAGRVEVVNRGIGDAVIATRTRTTLRRRHAAVAKCLERIRDRGATSLEIAGHYLLSGQSRKGIRNGLASIEAEEIDKNRAAAIPILERLSEAAKGQPKSVRARILYALADARIREIGPRDVLPLIEEYREIVPRTEPKERRAVMERYAAQCYDFMTEYEKADAARERALELVKPGSPVYFETVVSYAGALEYRGRLEQTEKLLRGVLDRFGKLKDRGVVRVWIQLVRLSISRNMMKEALEYIEKALALADELGIREDEELENLPGVTQLILGEYETAKEHLLRARQYAIKHNNYQALAVADMNLMLGCFRMGQNDEAMKYCTEAEGIYRQYADFKRLATLYSKVGGLSIFTLGADTALNYLKKGLDYARLAKAQTLEYNILDSLADVAQLKFDFVSSLRYSEQACELAERVLNVQPIGPLGTKAISESRSGNLSLAFDTSARAVEAAKVTSNLITLSSARTQLCDIAKYMGRLGVVMEQIREFENLTPKVRVIQRYNNLMTEAWAWLDFGRIGHAAEILKRIEEEIKKVGMDAVRAGAMLLKAKIAVQRYRFDEAESDLRSAQHHANPDFNMEYFLLLLEIFIGLRLRQQNIEEARKQIEMYEKTLAGFPNESPLLRVRLRLFRSRLALLEGDRQTAYNESMSGFLESKGIGYRLHEIEFAKIAAETSRDSRESEGLKKDAAKLADEMVAGLDEEFHNPIRAHFLAPSREYVQDPASGEVKAPISDSAESLLQLAVFLTREDNPQRSIEAILDAAFTSLDAKRGFLVVRESEGLTFTGSRHVSGEVPDAPEREVSTSVIDRVISTGEQVFSDSAKDDTVFATSQSIMDLELLSVLAVPVRIGGGIMGCLYLDNGEKASAFDEKDRRRAQYLASLAGAVLERQILMQQMKETTDSLSYRFEKQSAEFEIIRQELDDFKRTQKVDEIIGQSSAIRTLKEAVQRAAATDLPVLLTGEVGTGKNLVAKVLHEISTRPGRFIAVNCAAIPETLFQAEFFGVERGAFTGAEETKPGLFELSDGGTLFLDEIVDLPPTAQRALLRAVAEGSIRKVGGREPIAVDVRIISTANQDISRMTDEDAFRADLLYRLNAIDIELPALREREGDITLLASYFLGQIAESHGGIVKPLTLESINKLESYSWPGNVRELRNVLERAFVIADEKIEPEHLGIFEKEEHISSGPAAEDKPQSLEDVEREHILKVLAANDGKIRATARDLKITRNRLRRKLDKYREQGHLVKDES
ncbi:MAG: sigma 54-interacting transcriptional regulator [Planctomycetota bacterium]|jgi:transcriptional regulator with GAF, ATPase, and Fis domain